MVRTILALMKKEFLQVLRDHNMLRMIFMMPIFQLFLLGYVATTDVKLISTAVYDHDRSELSREYVRSLSAGEYFLTDAPSIPLLQAERGFKENLYEAVLIIPHGFSNDLEQSKSVDIGFVVDGTNANSASIALGYANVMTRQFNERVTGFSPPIKLTQRKLFNPEGESVYYMVPGIVALLLTMITAMLSAMAIVREREIGTLEQLMVTPIRTPALILDSVCADRLCGDIFSSICGNHVVQNTLCRLMGAALFFGLFVFVHQPGNRHVYFHDFHHPAAGNVFHLVFCHLCHNDLRFLCPHCQHAPVHPILDLLKPPALLYDHGARHNDEGSLPGRSLPRGNSHDYFRPRHLHLFLDAVLKAGKVENQ